jgi:hypothetical protein
VCCLLEQSTSLWCSTVFTELRRCRHVQASNTCTPRMHAMRLRSYMSGTEACLLLLSVLLLLFLLACATHTSLTHHMYCFIATEGYQVRTLMLPPSSQATVPGLLTTAAPPLQLLIPPHGATSYLLLLKQPHLSLFWPSSLPHIPLPFARALTASH